MKQKIVVFLTSISIMLCAEPAFPQSSDPDISFVQLRKLADEMMVDGRYAEAADFYNRALDKNTEDMRALAGLGMALGRQLKLDEADEKFDKVLSIDPKDPVAHCGKAMILLDRLQSVPDSDKNQRSMLLKKAGLECNSAIDADPRIVEAHYLLGRVYREEGRYDRAIQAFSGALRLDPGYANAYIGLGGVQLAKNDFVGAQDTLNRVIQMNPKNASAHAGLGQVYLKRGQVEEGIKELTASLTIAPNNSQVHTILGTAYKEQGNSASAIKEFEQAIQNKPDNDAPYLGIAEVNERRGDYIKAIAVLRSALQAMPEKTAIELRIAHDNLKIELFDDALAEYERVLAVSPNDSEAAQGIADALYLKHLKGKSASFWTSKDYEHAVDLLKQAKTANPDSIEMKFPLIQAQIVDGYFNDQALKALNVDTVGQRFAYSQTLFMEQKFQESLDAVRTAIAQAQSAEEVLHIADRAFMIRDLDGAEIAFRKVSTFPGFSDAGLHGLDAVNRARDAANQELAAAFAAVRVKAYGAAVDKFHAAIFDNPRTADARLGLAQSLEKIDGDTSPDAGHLLNEAIMNYKAYLALSPLIPAGERDKIVKRMNNLRTKLARLQPSANMAKSNSSTESTAPPGSNPSNASTNAAKPFHISLPKIY